MLEKITCKGPAQPAIPGPRPIIRGRGLPYTKSMASSWTVSTLLAALPADDPDVQRCLDFLARQRVHLHSWQLAKHIGAIWLPGRHIVFNRRYLPASGQPNLYALSLFLHEICHLQQGVRVALSVYGELEAWQLGFRFWQRHSDRRLSPVLQELLSLPLVRQRDVLLQARALMRAHAGNAYRADLLPLFPWGGA